MSIELLLIEMAYYHQDKQYTMDAMNTQINEYVNDRTNLESSGLNIVYSTVESNSM